MRQRIKRTGRSVRKVFLVICEGETEKTYIELLKRYYRLPVIIKTKVSGNRINSRLLNEYLKELGLESNADYKVFFVYDMDIEEIVKRLCRMNGISILSNPCVELWFHLHSDTVSRITGSREIVKKLCITNKIWGNYNKGYLSSQQEIYLLSHIGDACIRAKDMKWPDNPSTNFHELISIFEKEKKT